jgi:crotonobetainyl-CoA:carnitine CoA-transferase CaiB-like acyl-CoA transferase
MTMPPKLGEHSVEIMTSLGYEPDQIQKLLESGVVYHTSSGNVIDFGN